MEAVVSWTNVELFLLSLYIALLGGPKNLAATAYLAIETQSAKTAVIQAVARERLAEPHQKLLTAILSLAKTAQKGRDRLVHWTWGYSDEIKDGFLLVNPKDCVDGQAPTHDKILVYKKRDFDDLVEANDRLCGYGASFRKIVIRPKVPSADELFDQLCREPEIQEKLNPRA